jgi:hypothetical protein
MPAIIAGGSGGGLPLTFRGVEVGDKNISVTAFAPDSSSGGYLLRLWESAGKTCETDIRLPDGAAFRSAQPVDLRGRKTGRAIPVVDGKLRITCPANRPVSLVLSEEPAKRP